MQAVIWCRVVENHIPRQRAPAALIDRNDANGMPAALEVLTCSKSKTGQITGWIQDGKGQNIFTGWVPPH